MAYGLLKDFSVVAGDARVNLDVGGAGGRIAAYDTTSGKGLGNKAIKFNGLTNILIGPAMSLQIRGGDTHFPGRQLSGQFTLEMLVYYNGTPSSDTIYGGSGALLITRTGGTGLRLSTFNGTAITSTMAAATLTHIAVTRNAANLMTFWVNGVSAGTTTDATGWNPAFDAHFFASANSSGSMVTSDMYLSGVRITSGVCRYTSGFTPPSSDWPTTIGGDPDWNSVVALITGEERFVTDVNETEDTPLPPLFPIITGVAAFDPEAPGAVWDVEDGGLYEIVVGADLTVLNSPSNTPFYGRVDLMVEKSRRVIRSTWSDPVDGSYAFRYLKYDPVAQLPKYTLMGWDHTIAQRRAVIADGQIPDLMTVFP